MLVNSMNKMRVAIYSGYKNSRLSFMIIILFTIFIGQLQAINLKLKTKVSCNQNIVYLSDVIDQNAVDQLSMDSLSRIKIGEISDKQNFINISNKQIMDAVKESDHSDIKIIGPLVSVYRNLDLISNDEIKIKIEDYIRKQVKLSENAEIEFLRLPQVKRPVGEYLIEVFSPELKTDNGRHLFVCKVISDNQIIEEFTVNLKIYDIYEVYQLKNSMKQGEVFTANNLIKSFTKEILNNKYNMSYQEILESVTSSYLPKGKILTVNDIRTEPLVKKQDIVDVVIEGNAFKMNYKALAKNNAWLGEQVTLQNLDNKKCFNARVIAKNTVLIDLEEK